LIHVNTAGPFRRTFHDRQESDVTMTPSSAGRADGATKPTEVESREVLIPPLGLGGTLRIPRHAKAVVVFAHGSGSSRFSPRNVAVAEALSEEGLATLLFDLLTADEEADRRNVFDIPLLRQRLIDAVRWIDGEPALRRMKLGLFGASTGAAAALMAAAHLGERVGAVVSRGGRPDLAGDTLDEIVTPTLLIVGGADHGVIELNQQAFARLQGTKSLVIVPGATHLFPERGALAAVIDHATRWFVHHLDTRPPGGARSGEE
jgi:pimeloyl-ACP methyl ester carboxylesterase